MSNRAIQRLRDQKAELVPDETIDEEEDSSDDEDNNGRKHPTGGAFAAMMGDDSNSDSSSSDQDSEDLGNDNNNGDPVGDNRFAGAKDESPDEAQAGGMQNIIGDGGDKKPDADSKQPGQPKEDIDALLEEFKLQDEDPENDDRFPNEDGSSSSSNIFTSGMDFRDLDIDYVMRTALLGSSASGGESSIRSNRRTQMFLFGLPRQDSNVRPPRLVGGGIGMASYIDTCCATTGTNADTSSSIVLPWPYNKQIIDDQNKHDDLNRWFTFIHSDTYEKDCDLYDQIKASGDPNALTLFVAHHPFLTEGLLQLSTVLYQMNQSQEGLALLRRALWVYECSALPSFTKIEDGRPCFVDYQQPENYYFFLALFRLVRVSCVAGLPRVCLAVSRYILSLDPQRDPLGLLLAIDHFALSTNEEAHAAWLVEFVESEKVRIRFIDSADGKEYDCDLLSLPNFAYSYALSLHHMNQATPSLELEQKAKGAIKLAVRNFPGVIEKMLVANGVEVVGRSFQIDWPSALEYSRNRSKQAHYDWAQRAVTSVTVQAYELIVKIFVQQNSKLWKSQGVLRWIHDCLMELKSAAGSESGIVSPLSPAIRRYGRSDPTDYEAKFQTMPPEANPLDMGLVQRALIIDPNRRRLFQQNMPRGGRFDTGNDINGQPNGPPFAGPPTQVIDPDWPILEVFWRSALPWNQVDGIPPPRR